MTTETIPHYGESEVDSRDILYRDCMIYVADKEKITSEDFVNRMVGTVFSKEGGSITRRELENRTYGEKEYESLPLPYISMILPEHIFKGDRNEILNHTLSAYSCVLVVTHQHSGNFSFEVVIGEGTSYMETLIQQVSKEMRDELIASIS